MHGTEWLQGVGRYYKGRARTSAAKVRLMDDVEMDLAELEQDWRCGFWISLL